MNTGIPGPNDQATFLSYNSSDRKAVLDIQAALRVKEITTFLDRDSLRPGTQWFDALEKAIDSARAVVVFVGPSGLGVWQKREMVLALDKQARMEKSQIDFFVIPVLLPGSDLSQAPGFLMLNSWIDFRNGLTDTTVLEVLVRAIGGDTALTNGPR